MPWYIQYICSVGISFLLGVWFRRFKQAMWWNPCKRTKGWWVSLGMGHVRPPSASLRPARVPWLPLPLLPPDPLLSPRGRDPRAWMRMSMPHPQWRSFCAPKLSGTQESCWPCKEGSVCRGDRVPSRRRPLPDKAVRLQRLQRDWAQELPDAQVIAKDLCRWCSSDVLCPVIIMQRVAQQSLLPQVSSSPNATPPRKRPERTGATAQPLPNCQSTVSSTRCRRRWQTCSRRTS
jgi:hypothetical protein